MKWKNKKKTRVSRVPGGGGIQSDADKLHDKMEEMNQEYGGTGGIFYFLFFIRYFFSPMFLPWLCRGDECWV